MKKLLLGSICVLSLFSCTKENADNSSATPPKSTVQTTPCGQVMTTALLAGQHIDAGTITVQNDANNLYVTYTTTNGWQLQETHLYAGDCNAIPVNNAGNPKIGNFPFADTHTAGTTTHTFSIPLQSLPNCMCIAAHASVVKVENGQIVQSETAWGQGDGFSAGSWAMFFEYCKQDCDQTSELCYQEETAWATGSNYVSQGNWATYTAYTGTAQSVQIFAGQHILVGTVNFSAPNAANEVQIEIVLDAPWTLQNVSEGVKIQGYDSVPPASNPAPGSFDTYKGNSLSVTVPQLAYYGIHLDVQKEIECE